jgi:hypothetical protein
MNAKTKPSAIEEAGENDQSAIDRSLQRILDKIKTKTTNPGEPGVGQQQLIPEAPAINASDAKHAKPHKARGAPSSEAIRNTMLRLVEQEQLGLFETIPLKPGNEFPTLLARLPIFPAITRTRQKPLLDADNAFPFETPFGRGRRHGPPVNVEDEDYLFGLCRLREKCLIGEGSKLPIPVASACFADQKGRVSVHVVHCTLSQLLQETGVGDSGKNFRLALASLKRLAAIVVELEVNKPDLYFGTATHGTSFKLLDIVWQSFEEQGVIVAQFHPLVAQWLMKQATYMDWNVRRKLQGRNARALHRFLSTQPKQYAGDMLNIAKTIGWEGERRQMKSKMLDILAQLKELEWINTYKITGTGRKVRFRLHISRP